MSIGAGIFLFVVGAILTFALDVDLGWINLDLVGYILMGAGFLVFLLGIVLLMRRRQTDTVTRSAVDPAGQERITRQTTRSPGDDIV